MEPRRTKVLIIDSTTEKHFPQPDIERKILAGHDVHLAHISNINEIPAEILPEIEFMIIWACIPSIQFNQAFLRNLGRCRAIVKAAVGYDNVDIDAARQLDIAVYNIPDYGTEEVADHALALMLGVARKLNDINLHVRQGGWDWASVKKLYRLRDKTLGIIGFGRIGGAVAKRAAAFGLKIRFYDPYVASGIDKTHGVTRCESLEELLASSDIVSVNASLNRTSHHLLSAPQFQQMKEGVLLVNTARGGIVDSQALLAALKSGKVAAAGLDVLENEPDIPAGFRTLDNVILTAHSAFYTEESFLEMRTKSAELLLGIMAGVNVRNRVNGNGILQPS
ncbi:C-terminal binding protein [Serratia inhibens]|uniref:C-terminal binding protein n=1 Tax=Serratia inhibens TaxID=2338073 RepID=UPI00025E3C55|nr:C-terminal binding protein [Serratia inhibens]ANS44578.1 Hydroxypyruvate reductase [Serratia inhibens PRI-2C]